ncbi:MAG: hypothetical protein EON90_09905 [Brevundimonas sp.]|nr:MAG: hypothetical protein EON90_09905 [Brevundimonas sp.]
MSMALCPKQVERDRREDWQKRALAAETEVAALRALSAVPDDGLGSSAAPIPTEGHDTAVVADLIAALEPFALLADGPCADSVNMNDPLSKWIRIGHLHAARDAIDRAISARKQAATADASQPGIGAADEPKAAPTGDAEGAVVGLEQWGWRVRFKADEKRAAGPWSWQDKPLDRNTEQWAEQEPVYAPATPAGSE